MIGKTIELDLGIILLIYLLFLSSNTIETITCSDITGFTVLFLNSSIVNAVSVIGFLVKNKDSVGELDLLRVVKGSTSETKSLIASSW